MAETETGDAGETPEAKAAREQQEAADAAAHDTAQSSDNKRGPGRPSKAAKAKESADSPEVAALKAKLADMEARENATREQNRQLIGQQAADRKSTTRVITDPDDDKPEPALGVQFIGNPRAGFEGPEFETMRGYRFEKGGDAILVKGTEEDRAKFRGNDHFLTWEVEDGREMADGEARPAPKPTGSGRPKVGKVA